MIVHTQISSYEGEKKQYNTKFQLLVLVYSYSALFTTFRNFYTLNEISKLILPHVITVKFYTPI